MLLIVMATPLHRKSCLTISECHMDRVTSKDRYVCKNIAHKVLKDRPRLDEELRDSN